MTPDTLWQYHLHGSDLLHTRPDFRFDPAYYAAANPEVGAAGYDMAAHYRQFGEAEGRAPNLYQRIANEFPDLTTRLADILTDPDALTLLRTAPDTYTEPLFELLALGEPQDRRIGSFSAQHYLRRHPEVAAAALPPLLHWLRFGRAEGRATLADLRPLDGGAPLHPDRPTCLICLPDCARSEANLAALTLIQSAAQSHNVILAAQAGGDLLDALRHAICEMLITDHPDADLPLFQPEGLEGIGFALLHSAAAFRFAAPLVRQGLPFACVIRDFPEHLHPPHAPLFAALFADLLVFPAAPVAEGWQGVLADLGFDTARDAITLPPALPPPAPLDRAAHDAARARLTALTGVDCTARRIVLGAGPADWAHGADLFALTAQLARASAPDLLFIWIGDGPNPQDQGCGVWIDRHWRMATTKGPAGNFFAFPDGPARAALFRAADTLYLPARRAVLPDAVPEALRAQAEVVLFRGATGFDDPASSGHPALHSVAFGDLPAALATLQSLPPKRDRLVAAPPAPPPPDDTFARIAAALRDRLAAQRLFTLGGGSYDVPVLFSAHPPDRAARQREREKIWSKGRHFIWQSADEASAALAASDHPTHAACRIEPFAPPPEGLISPRYSIHLHAYYLDDLAEDLARYPALRHAERLILTTDTDEKTHKIKGIMADLDLPAQILRLPNQGRDILPFLRVIESLPHLPDDDIWCHLHQKKAPGTSAGGDVWRRFLMDILLGDGQDMPPALAHLADPATGLVAAFDPYRVDWSGARRLLPDFKRRWPAPLPDSLLLFPVGNMFWTRAGVARRLHAGFGPDMPWPNEPLASDGTVYHLIERLWPAACQLGGMQAIFLDKPGQPRV